MATSLLPDVGGVAIRAQMGGGGDPSLLPQVGSAENVVPQYGGGEEDYFNKIFKLFPDSESVDRFQSELNKIVENVTISGDLMDELIASLKAIELDKEIHRRSLETLNPEKLKKTYKISFGDDNEYKNYLEKIKNLYNYIFVKHKDDFKKYVEKNPKNALQPAPMRPQVDAAVKKGQEEVTQRAKNKAENILKASDEKITIETQTAAVTSTIDDKQRVLKEILGPDFVIDLKNIIDILKTTPEGANINAKIIFEPQYAKLREFLVKSIKEKMDHYSENIKALKKDEDDEDDNLSIIEETSIDQEAAEEDAEENAEEDAKEPVKEDTKEDAKETVQEDAKENAKEDAKEAVQEDAKENAKEDAKENAKEDTKEDVKKDAKEDVEEDVKEDAKEPVKEAAENTQVVAKEATKSQGGKKKTRKSKTATRRYKSTRKNSNRRRR
jgi:hypothetical protein